MVTAMDAPKVQRVAALSSALLAAGFLFASDLAAQQQRQEQRQSQAQPPGQRPGPGMAHDQQSYYENRLEDYLVIRLAEYSNLIPAIKVQVQNRSATLSGRVPSEAAKSRALRIARTTRGITSVRDQLSIDPSMTKVFGELGRNVDRSQLAQQVARRIAANIEGAKAGEDWWFTGWRVEGPNNTWNLVTEVEDDGSVVLEGEVPSLDTMRKAVEAAATVPGVRRIDTDLELQGYGYPYAGYGRGAYRDRGYAFRGPYYGPGGYPYAYGYYPYYPPYAFAPQAWYPPEGEERASSR